MKNKIFIAFAFLLLLFSFTAFAAVELNDNYFYDSLSGSSCFFAVADEEGECGIILTDKYGNVKEYPSKIKTKDGKYGILLKDPTGILNDTYTISAYIKKNNNYILSENKLSFNARIISAGPDNITEAVSGLKAGDVLLLESGVYENININITASGTEDNPITIRNQNPESTIFTLRLTKLNSQLIHSIVIYYLINGFICY